MRVLVAYPVQRGRLFRRSLDSVLGQEWDGRLDVFQMIGGDDPATEVGNIVRKYNAAREVVLGNGYDALFTAECDIIMPRDALKRLAMVDADVAYGLYVWRRGWPSWNAYSYVGERDARSFSRDLELAKKSWGKVVEVKGLGNGCTLIHRRVLERFPFRAIPVLNYSCDWALSLDCQEAGFVQKNDLSIICGHIETKPVPLIRWPDITKRGLYRVTDVGPIPPDLETNALVYLRGGNGEMKVRVVERFADGGKVSYPGEVVNISSEKALKLIQRGIAAPLDRDQLFETTAEYAKQFHEQKARGCCPEEIGSG